MARKKKASQQKKPMTVAEAGSLGGKARAEKLSAKRRREIAALGGKSVSPEAASKRGSANRRSALAKLTPEELSERMRELAKRPRPNRRKKPE